MVTGDTSKDDRSAGPVIWELVPDFTKEQNVVSSPSDECTKGGVGSGCESRAVVGA